MLVVNSYRKKFVEDVSVFYSPQHPPATTYLKAIISPAAELQHARLFVKGKVLDIDLAGGLVNGGRFPFDQALGIDGRLGGQSHLEIAIRTYGQG